MIIVRTPFRISFFGGGTDYPAWYREHGGSVLGTTIDKYCYLSLRILPPFFEHKYRIVYSQTENTKTLEDIHHPSVREGLTFMGIKQGVELHHDADLPARTGLGSSSTFIVALLHSLYTLKGKMPSKLQLAKEAIHIEQDVLKQNVGSQDQTWAAFGGLNRIDFNPDDSINIKPVTLTVERVAELEKHLMLVFTGFSRTASEIAGDVIGDISKHGTELSEIQAMVQQAQYILNSDTEIREFGKLLDRYWHLKKSLGNQVSNTYVDYLYKTAKQNGADGAKLMGAGGGGFMLVFAEPEAQVKIKGAMDGILNVPFHFERAGSQVIFYEPDGYVE